MAKAAGTSNTDKSTAKSDAAKTNDSAAKTDAAKTAGAAADDPADDPPAGDAPKSDPPAKTYTQAEYERAIEKAKKEAEKEREAAEQRAKLSEEERLKAERDDLQKQLRMRDAKDEVVEALTKAGAKNASLLFRSVQGDLEFDEKTGKLSNLKDLLKDLQADFPDQFGIEKPEETIDGGKGKEQGGKLTKEQLTKMSPAEINELDWEEVKKVMAEK